MLSRIAVPAVITSSTITMLSPAYALDESGAFILDEAGAKVIDMANSIFIDWGAFISAVINFLLIAFVLFTLVRIINRIAAAQDKFAGEQLLVYKKKKII